MEAAVASRRSGPVAAGWMALLVAATFGIALVASVEPSPLLPPLPEGLRPPESLSGIARSAGFGDLSPAGLTVFAQLVMALSVVAFLALCLLAWRRQVSTRAAVWLGLVLIAGVTILPPLMSRDVYSYAMYGRIWAVEGSNPYLHTPKEFPGHPFFDVTSQEWFRAPSVYGPAFTIVSGGIVEAFGSTAGTVLAFKVLAALSLAATLPLVVRLAERTAPGRGAFAAVLVGLNPVLLFHTVGGGHNDTVVGLAVVGAVALWPRRWLLATAVLTIGTLVKIVAVVPLALALGAVFLGAGPGIGRRVRALAPHAGVAAGLGTALLVPFGLSVKVLEAFATLVSRQGWASPVRLGVYKLRDAGANVGGAGLARTIAVVVQVAFVVVAVLVLLLILRRLAQSDPRAPASEAWGWALLVVTLCAAYLLPWYAAWSIPVLALGRRMAPVLAAVGLSALLALGAVPAEPELSPPFWDAMLLSVHYVVAPAVLAVLAIVLIDLRRVLLGPPA